MRNDFRETMRALIHRSRESFPIQRNKVIKPEARKQNLLDESIGRRLCIGERKGHLMLEPQQRPAHTDTAPHLANCKLVGWVTLKD
jgi:hypothetical protein